MAHKYHAIPTVIDGIRFASKKEARRYQELKLLEKAGEIWELELQPKFPLIVMPLNQTHAALKVGEYRADFAYYDKRRRSHKTIEDCKGVKTETYRLKKKMVEAIYGIQILET